MLRVKSLLSEESRWILNEFMQELNFEFPGLRIGSAENEMGPTGCTVIAFEEAVRAAIDVRGGAAAVRESSCIDEMNAEGVLDAIVLAGGSTYGLEAASGVAAELFKERKGDASFAKIPVIPSAIVYDFRERKTNAWPDRELGAEAYRAARAGSIGLGRVGAGRNVSVGKIFGATWAEWAGQGAAYVQIGGVRLLAISVVNAIGNVIAEDGRVLAGSRDPMSGQRLDAASAVLHAGSLAAGPVPQKGNTTISALVTDADLDRLSLKRLAVMAHTAMARAIDPFHAPTDGDVLFVATTAKASVPDGFSLARLGMAAGRLMQDAVRASLGGRRA
jgi:L-aminopeptidase/D-esterase-like protein